MEKYKLQAWDILTQAEKSLLKLTIVEGKTLAEAHVILGLRRYKADEFLLRAKKFFIMFSEYFEYNETLFPPEVYVEPKLKQYLELVILKRLKKKPAAQTTGAYWVISHNSRLGSIANLLFWLRDNGYKDLFDLIRTFDAWNNFRILPTHVRKPSPFIRRQKKAYIHIVSSIKDLSELGYETLLRVNGDLYPPVLYVPLVAEFLPNGFTIMAVRNADDRISYYSHNKFPMFVQKRDAIRAMELVLDWSKLSLKSSGVSKKFWNEFRAVMDHAFNKELLLGAKNFDLTDKQVKELKALGSFSKNS